MHIIKVFVLVFVCITFLFSAIEKTTDWNGQLYWFKNHFANTFLRPQIKALLLVLIILDYATGILSLVGIFEVLFCTTKDFGFYALILAIITILCMLFGQRVARDYPGASSLAVYFLVLIFGLYLFLL